MRLDTTVVIAPLLGAATLFLSVPAVSAQETSAVLPEHVRDCVNIAVPALKAIKASTAHLPPNEIQKQLPATLKRFAARPEVGIALDCLLNYVPAKQPSTSPRR